jgi:hypothetical protein
MLQRRSFLALLAAGAFGSSIFAEDQVAKQLLRYRYNKGEELRWNVQQSLKLRSSIRGNEETVETTSRSVKIWKVLSVTDDGTATFEYRVEDIDMRQVQTGRDPATYNSRKDKTIPSAFINLEGKVGIPLAQIKIDPLGKSTKKPLREYAGSFSENRIVIPLPVAPIAAGGSWTVPLPIEIPQQNGTVKKVNAQQKFTLDSLRSGIAKIKFITQIFTPLTPKEESKILENYSVGKMELDFDAGHFIRQEITIDKTAVGIQGNSDSITYQSRLTECCCGRKFCEICSPAT